MTKAWKNPTPQEQSPGVRAALDSLGKRVNSALIADNVQIASVSNSVTSFTYIDAYSGGAADLTVLADTGDWVMLMGSFPWSHNLTVTASCDFYVVTSGIYVANGTTTSAQEGLGCLFGQINSADIPSGAQSYPVGGSVMYQIKVGDVDTGGHVTFRPRIAASASQRNIVSGSACPAHFSAVNMGHGA